MKKVVKRLLLVGSMIIVAILLASIFYISIEDKMKVAKTYCTEEYHGPSDIIIEQEIKLGDGLWHPITNDPNITLYCREPGMGVYLPSQWEIRSGMVHEKSEIFSWRREEEISDCIIDFGHALDCEHWEHRSYTYQVCTGEHYTESDSYYNSYRGLSVTNLYDVAYILSIVIDPLRNTDDTPETWNAVVQQAIWRSPVTEIVVTNRGYQNERGRQLYEASQDYKKFYEKIVQGQKGVKARDLTDQNKLSIEANTETKKLTIGPFSLDYINGRFDKISYGGMSDMYLKDKNGKRIDIKAFIFDDRQYSTPQSVTTAEQKLQSNYGEPSFFTYVDQVHHEENINKVDYYAAMQYYPNPQEKFWVEIEYAGEPTTFTLHADFEWLECYAEICLREGKYWWLDQYENDRYFRHGWPHWDGRDEYPEYGCRKRLELIEEDTQDCVLQVSGRRTIGRESIEIPVGKDYPLTNTMKIGGKVYEEFAQGKENMTNGILDSGDILLPNVEVALYDAETNQLAKLATAADEKVKESGEDYKRRINPTLTDEKGYYEFRGVSMEKKYYVRFTYNGQSYLATDYLANVTGENGQTSYKFNSVKAMVDAKEYDGPTNEGVSLRADKWKVTSKGTEKPSEREALTDTFSSIGSSPENYPSSNSLGIKLSNGYNKTFHNYELAGYTLNANGQYVKSGKQLVDTYLTLQNGNLIDMRDPAYKGTAKIQEGEITKAIKDYIKSNKKYPTDMKSQIYNKIAGGDQETWKKLQFIEDCKIHSYTKAANTESESGFDQYPVYKQFTTHVKSGNKYPNNSYASNTFSENASTYDNIRMKHHGNGTYGQLLVSGDPNKEGIKLEHTNLKNDKGEIVYKNVYRGQLEIHQGLVRRAEFDASLKKDVFKAGVKINGRTEIYKYDGRDEDEDSYWEIRDRVKDYNNYYGGNYQRQLYPSDVNYTGQNPLEVYVTYKITVRNQSQGILAQIDEIVDYYDSSYEFEEDLSWVMYGERTEVRVTDKEYYEMIETGQRSRDRKYKDVEASAKGKYNSPTRFNLGSNYNSIYVNGLSNHKLEVGETAYVYLTFRVGKNGNKLKLDNTEAGKQNIAEINGYTTYYQDGTTLPNGVKKGSKDYAGMLDRDSTPGNFDSNALRKTSGGKYEHNFEDDTDRAKGIKIYEDTGLSRKISGMVWEDKRTYNPQGTEALIGNGLRETELSGNQKEKGAEKVKVELWDVQQKKVAEVYSGGGWKPAVLNETGTDGKYLFDGYIPGDYVVRFTYNIGTYNGQDYKSTIYQRYFKDGKEVAIDQNGFTDVEERYKGYTDIENQNETQTYGYDIYKADSFGQNVSDAKDIWSARENVNKYTEGSIGNNQAQNLWDVANGDKNLNELQSKLDMVAETGVISMEVEYNRGHSEGDNNADNDGYGGEEGALEQPDKYHNGNNKNGKYHVENVDFGLEERPKAGLELNKKVSNVKITLANGETLFDATQTGNNLIWKNKVPYNVNEMKKETKYDNIGPKVQNGSENVYSDYTRYKDLRDYILNNVKTIATSQNGLIQATMDEEIMHGATIQILYDITVTNIGEIDYDEKSFYYIGKVANPSSMVTTSADLLVDYVENNLQFRANSNDSRWGWQTITKEELGRYVSDEVKAEANKYNTIIKTEGLKAPLIPATEKNVRNNIDKTQKNIKLILTQLITSQNTDDNKSYGNTAEIVTISNSVGRRMAYSVQGNQKPNEPPTEPDASRAEQVVILPPFGDGYLYLGLGIFVLTLLGVSIIVIKKTVLGKNKF